MREHIRYLTVVLVLGLVAAACTGDSEEDVAGQDDNDVTEEEPAEDDGDDGDDGEDDADDGGEDDAGSVDVSGELFAFGFGYETGDEIAQVRVDEFRDQYPDVDIEFSEGGFDEQGFLSAAASDSPPDLVNIPRNLLGTFVSRGVLQPLDECIAQEDVDMDVFYQGALDQVNVDGSYYAFPEFFNSRVWILNDDAFEEAGLDASEVDLSDWDALTDINEQLTATDGGSLTRLGLDPKLPEFLPLWAWANGSPMLSEDGLTANLDDPGVAEVLEVVNEWHEPAGGRTSFLDFRDTWDFFGEGNQYAADQLGAMPMEQWYINTLAGASPDANITVRPFETPEGEPITWADGNSWAIPVQAQNPEAACAFAATMVHADTWVAAAESRAATRAEEGAPNTGVYTGNAEADDVIFSELVDLSDFPAFEEAVNVVVENQENAFGWPPSPAASAWQTAWEDAVNDVMLEGADPVERLQAAQEEAQAAIDAAAG